LRNRDRVIDKTFLSADHADERIIRHRDLVGHAFRWAHVSRYLSQNQRYKDAIVLDCGCGKELPLAKMLYSNRLIPKSYVGVDANRLEIPEMLRGKKLPITLWSETDFCALKSEHVGVRLLSKGDEGGPGYDDYALPDVFVSLEVAEHMEPLHCRNLFKHALEITSEDCHYFISTPAWDRVNTAENHLNEVTAEAFGSMLEDIGYHIVGFWGTFASQKDYRPTMEGLYPGITAIFEKLAEYYDSTVISTTFAPLLPMRSRNILWHLTRKIGDAAKQERLFDSLASQQNPWTSHRDWLQLSGYSHRHTAECASPDGSTVCGQEGIWLPK